MTKIRVAVGAGAAILVVGAVIHLKPSSRLTAEAFVSAVYTNTPGVGVTGTADEIAKLPVCDIQTASAVQTPTVAFAAAEDWDNNAAGAYATKPETTIYVTDKACVCGKFALTKGRVCEASGNANPKGQSYLPRCPPLGTDIPQSYSAGCWCGVDADFTTANSNLAIDPGITLGTVLTAGETAPAAAECIDTSKIICLKGEACSGANAAAAECTPPGGTALKRRQQKYVWMLPKIKENGLMQTTICKSTALQVQQCDTTTSTAQTGNKPLCKDM